MKCRRSVQVCIRLLEMWRVFSYPLSIWHSVYDQTLVKSVVKASGKKFWELYIQVLVADKIRTCSKEVGNAYLIAQLAFSLSLVETQL